MNSDTKPSPDHPQSTAAQPGETVAQPERTMLQRIFSRQGAARAALLPLLAVFTALVIGAVIIVTSSPDVARASNVPER